MDGTASFWGEQDKQSQVWFLCAASCFRSCSQHLWETHWLGFERGSCLSWQSASPPSPDFSSGKGTSVFNKRLVAVCRCACGYVYVPAGLCSCAYVYVCAHTSMCVCMPACQCVLMYLHAGMCICECLYIYMHDCVLLCMHSCMCVHAYICVCMYFASVYPCRLCEIHFF